MRLATSKIGCQYQLILNRLSKSFRFKSACGTKPPTSTSSIDLWLHKLDQSGMTISE